MAGAALSGRDDALYRRVAESTCIRQFDFDPSQGVPLSAWLIARRREGWRPLRGALSVVQLVSGTRLCFLMRRVQVAGADEVPAA